MYFSKFTVVALIGLAAAAPVANDDSKKYSGAACSDSQTTKCCDKYGKNCEVKSRSTASSATSL